MGLVQFENGFNLNTETIEYYCTIRIYTLLTFQIYKVCKF
jgi:hypothetical protein